MRHTRETVSSSADDNVAALEILSSSYSSYIFVESLSNQVTRETQPCEYCYYIVSINSN